MFSNFSRSVGRLGGATKSMMSRRMMSGGHSEEEAAAEVGRWYKMTIVMVGLSCGLVVYNIVAHDHEHVRTGLPYQRFRSKPYPWSCPDCNLFDGACWKECRDAVKEKEAGAKKH
ncbi:hypothetical protein B484DRAFT_394961 [Ochromonadaceae sp. CCMP2298]|nr:hypothetical protein B484DRAFT_396960 [Ochromonadaceae sp. CCMP2298]KAJ1432495.1 hypothetical protein B484DRAFT_394961 [Ochromonadaceae sp. CCMP2298]|mmetsp:Transcript_17076/g.37959  ORF Transcript_17076/g.37959 Transcript_17076/m.37959 type:complete len:115 (-) Transcript_17076:104-448(-)